MFLVKYIADTSARVSVVKLSPVVPATHAGAQRPDPLLHCGSSKTYQSKVKMAMKQSEILLNSSVFLEIKARELAKSSTFLWVFVSLS